MRTTIRLRDDLLVEAKKLSAESRTSLTALIEDALKERLARRRKKNDRPPVHLTTFGEGGLQPGVDLDDSAALLDHMEHGHDSP
jgi:hypothetical protein